MKKVTILAVILFGLLGCQKEEICNCGKVISDDVTDYSVVIRNSCSKNEKKFYLAEGDWMTAYVGSDYCITNVTNW
jgi:hypothetical protein